MPVTKWNRTIDRVSGAMKVDIVNGKGESISKLPGDRKKLLLELKVLWHGKWWLWFSVSERDVMATSDVCSLEWVEVTSWCCLWFLSNESDVMVVFYIELKWRPGKWWLLENIEGKWRHGKWCLCFTMSLSDVMVSDGWGLDWVEVTSF